MVRLFVSYLHNLISKKRYQKTMENSETKFLKSLKLKYCKSRLTKNYNHHTTTGPSILLLVTTCIVSSVIQSYVFNHKGYVGRIERFAEVFVPINSSSHIIRCNLDDRIAFIFFVCMEYVIDSSSRKEWSSPG